MQCRRGQGDRFLNDGASGRRGRQPGVGGQMVTECPGGGPPSGSMHGTCEQEPEGWE